MKALITHFKANDIGDVEYKDNKPIVMTTKVDFPVEFVYWSYNFPRTISGTKIEVENVLRIEVIN